MTRLRRWFERLVFLVREDDGWCATDDPRWYS